MLRERRTCFLGGNLAEANFLTCVLSGEPLPRLLPREVRLEGGQPGRVIWPIFLSAVGESRFSSIGAEHDEVGPPNLKGGNWESPECFWGMEVVE